MIRRALLVGLAFFAGVGAVGAVIAIVPFRDWGVGTSGDSVTSRASTTAARQVLPLEEFLDRWEASVSATYVVVGTVTQSSGAGDARRIEDSLSFRQARNDDRALDQLGDTAVVTAFGEQRDCQIFAGDEVACASPVSAVTADEERALVASELSEYLVYEHPEVECLELIAESPSNFGRWGQSSVVCFDAATRAVRLIETFRGDRQTVRVAESLSGVPSPADLEPGWE